MMRRCCAFLMGICKKQDKKKRRKLNKDKKESEMLEELKKNT